MKGHGSTAEIIPQDSSNHENAAGGVQFRCLLDDYIRTTEFKRLLNQLIMAQVRQGFRTLAVLSELPAEGKSFFSAALALAYAKYLIGRVLIADTIRQPRLQTLYFKAIRGQYQSDPLNNYAYSAPGLIDLLTTAETEQAACGTSDFILCSYLDSIKDRYDLLIVDTCAMACPGVDNIDPLIAAKHADTALVVTSQQSLESTVLSSIRNRVEQYQLNVVGAVFNRNCPK